MKVDTEKIEWLLKNATQYNISKNTGVAQATISNIINGKRALKNLTIEVGSILTEYAEQIKNYENLKLKKRASDSSLYLYSFCTQFYIIVCFSRKCKY